MVRLVPDITDADDGAAGLLIECRGWDESCLKVLTELVPSDCPCCGTSASSAALPPGTSSICVCMHCVLVLLLGIDVH